MRALTVLFASLVIFGGLHAYTGISGIVTDADNGQPIRYARVCCRAESSRAYTDSTGFYQFSELAPGSYTVTVGASGYQPDTFPDTVVVVQDSITDSINFALHKPPAGGISGQVLNASSEEPIVGAYVYAVGTSFHAYTDSLGYYEMNSMPVGKYLLHCRAEWYVYETYPESVPVVANQVTDSIDFALVPTGVIAGLVTSAASGQPIKNAVVNASGPNGYAYVYSDDYGRYVISMLVPPGRYRVRASAAGYETAYYPDSVTVVAGQLTDSINFALSLSGGISGRVVDAATGEPIRGAAVGRTGGGNVYTDSTGAYLMPTDAGRYGVYASATGFTNGIYPESVVVVQGEVTDSIDFGLVALSGHTGIGGRLTNGVKYLGIGGGTIHAEGPNGSGTATSVACGGYLIDSLAPGRYAVWAEAEGFQTTLYAESVTVVNGSVRENTNIYMTPLAGPVGAVSGRVTSSQNGQVIVGALVYARGPGGVGAVLQDSFGYLIANLPPGEYWVTASASGFDPGNFPDSVVVDSGQTTDSVDFQLQPRVPVGRLTGHVTSADSGQLIVNALVHATNAQYSYQVLQGQYDYHFYLPAGKYWVSAEAEGFEPGHYPDSVTVVAGQNVTGIDFVLQRAEDTLGGVSGIVTNAQTNDPILGALVVATGPGQGYTNTGAQGAYLIRSLIPGTYLAMACASGFQPSAWDTVEVLARTITPDVDFALQPTGGGDGGIAGVVVDAVTQQPVPGARVFAWCSSGQGCAFSDAAGDYLVHNLRAGCYRVRVEAGGYYPATRPEGVQVTEGQTTNGIGFSLRDVAELNAGIAGFAYDGYGQTEIIGARVRVTGWEGSWDVFTDEHGDYLADGLPAGDYLVEFAAPGYGSGQYAEPVTVTTGAISAEVNPALYPVTGVFQRRNTVGSDVLDLQVAPSPSRGASRLQWQVGKPGYVVLRVYDNTGRVVHTVQNGFQSPGRYAGNWNGTGPDGRRVANGIYYYRLVASGGQKVVKVTIVGR
jgi:hypothetical protein